MIFTRLLLTSISIFLFTQLSYATEVTFSPVWPSNWAKYQIDHSLVPIEEQQKCKEAVSRFTASYPAAKLDGMLKKITLLQSLTVDGAGYAGTNHYVNKEIFIVCREDSTAVVRTLHHEFSSLLIWNNKGQFDFTRWTNNNEKGFKSYALGWYGAASESAKLGLNGNQLNNDLIAKGFLTPYSTTSFENDFNRFAEFIFVLPEELLKIQDNDRINQKTKQFVAFYNTLGIPISLL